MEATINLKLSGYEILSAIHSQSQGDLYVANSTNLGKKVVIKNVPFLDDLHPAVINLRNEFEIIRYLTDEIKVSVHEILKHNDGHALIMDYIDGPSVKEIITSGKIELEKFFKLSLDIISNIQKIHSKKVIHKDIKPDNMLTDLSSGNVKIIDYGISTRLSKQESNWTSPNVLEGSISYISPEQTGRMNRSIDYRTDFYSLGVTFYEMLTGRLPFVSDDLLEVIHSHLAKTPELPHLIRADIPEMLSEIILKLMNKTAEDRYQSSSSIYADIERCYIDWKETGKVETFILGNNDFNEVFKIHQKLYGREKEVNKLIEEFRITHTSGRSKLILITGHSGVGKSSLVKEIYKPMTESKGHFISGKYDQYNRNIPYSAIIQAFSGLIKFILTESPESILAWKDSILNALGTNGRVITDVIPELEFITGEQPTIVELSAQENANRFYVLFQNFIKVFADSKHPLAIFFDDLQWADTPSLEIIKNLLTDPSVNYLYLMLSYRNNEIDKSHPFSLFLNSLNEEGVHVETLSLQPLTADNLCDLLADSLILPKANVSSLATLVFSKTAGNPFFVSELLKQLIAEELIYLKSGKWEWNEEQIKSTEISDNVIELLLKRIKKLEVSTQNILKLSACIGSNFDLSVLEGISKIDVKKLVSGLKETIAEELLLPLGDSYRQLDGLTDETFTADLLKDIKFRFQHDRIQHACYNLLIDSEKKEIHLKIARIQFTKTVEDLEDLIFDIVNHYNQSLDILEDEKEATRCVDLNFKAAKKAKLSSAYIPGLEMIRSALRIINGKFTILNVNKNDILKELAELEYLNGNFDESEKVALEALKNTTDPIEKAQIYNLLITQYSAKGKYDLALENINKALEPLGMNLPTEDLSSILEKEIAECKEIIGERKIMDLINLPLMTDKKKIAAVNILIGAIPTAYNKIPALFPVIGLKMVNLHLKYGNLPDSYGYSMYGVVLNAYSDFMGAYEFCNLAVLVGEKYKNPSGVTKASNILANYAQPFVRHIRYSEEVNNKCIKSSLESGELLHGSYGAMNDAVNIFYQGQRLDKISDKLEALYSYAKKVKSNLAIDTIDASRLVVPNLLGETTDYQTFQSETYTEDEFLKACDSHQSPFPVCLFKIMKAKTLLIYGEPKKALKELEEAEPLLAYINGQYSLTEHNFNQSLALAQLYKTFPTEKRKSVLEKIKDNQKKLKVWATSCAENYQNKYLLIEAELARLTYKNWKAAKFYDDAITQVRKHDFVQNEAQFLEIAGTFWLSKNNIKVGSQYIQESYNRYKFWGAETKCNLLQTKYPDFLGEGKKASFVISRSTQNQPGRATQTELYSGQTLDIQSVFKSSNAISGEIKLENLLQKLIKIVMENAGAERGILLLNKEGNLTVEACGDVKKESVELLSGTPLQNYNDIPISIIYYVMRTKENLVLSNCMNDDRFRVDPYIFKNNTKSILCSPILKQGEISGILYLENNLAEGAFTSDRLNIVSILSSQAAISLDNALLYNSLEEKVIERTKQLAQVNEELEEKNHHITDSINYAQNIQFAILPDIQVLKSAYNDIFVLYRPKDIVSGDFFWFSKQGNATLIAAVDCTGHGVPGALMSMIGNTLLNQIVNETHITDPGVILSTLNKNVRSALKQDIEDANSTDGMDMCLCKIEGNNLYFAGAKRPILIAREDGIEEVKGDRFSIGGRQNGERVFSTQEIPIIPGKKMVVYLTTDGFIDQPNLERQRIMGKGLQSIISDTYQKSAEEQKKDFEVKLETHSGGEPQRDDITVIGIVLS